MHSDSGPNFDLPEREILKDLWQASDKYEDEFGVKVENVSHWNPSTEFKETISEQLKAPHFNPIIDYVMATDFELSKGALEKLKFSATSSYALVTPTGSLSILSVLSLLKENGVTKLFVLAPFYWTVIHICRQFGIEVKLAYLERGEMGFSLPFSMDEIMGQATEKTAIWFTNPVYCTGQNIDKFTKGAIKYLLTKNAWVVMDECLARYGSEVGPCYSGEKRFLGIYAPHKGICVNGMKFSAVVANKEFKDFLEHWSTVHYGCLNSGNKLAVEHFLSDNFDLYSEAFRKKIKATRSFLLELERNHSNMNLDHKAFGYLNTVYFDHLEANILADLDTLWNMVEATGAIVIPGTRNHFSQKIGFCFRVNLAVDSPRFRNRLNGLIKYLCHQ